MVVVVFVVVGVVWSLFVCVLPPPSPAVFAPLLLLTLCCLPMCCCPPCPPYPLTRVFECSCQRFSR
jgi:hypothetical protein